MARQTQTIGGVQTRLGEVYKIEIRRGEKIIRQIIIDLYRYHIFILQGAKMGYPQPTVYRRIGSTRIPLGNRREFWIEVYDKVTKKYSYLDGKIADWLYQQVNGLVKKWINQDGFGLLPKDEVEKLEAALANLRWEP